MFSQKIVFLLLITVLVASSCSILDGGNTPTADFILPATQSGHTPAFEQETGQPDSTSAAALTDLPSSTQTPEDPIYPGDGVDPSALRVVYTISGDLWLWEAGETRQLTGTGTDYSPRISGDGTWIAFTRRVTSIHHELWALNIDGTNEKCLVSIEDLNTIGGGVRDPNAIAILPHNYQWVPGTHTLAFNTQQIFQGPGLSLLDDLNLVDVEDGKLTFLLLSGWGGEFFYSPNGSKVALSTPDTILLMDPDGKNYRPVLTYDQVNTYSEYRYYASPVWSQDGSFLRVAFPPVEPLGESDQVTEIWCISSDGSEVEQEGSIGTVPFFEDQYMRAVAFSPDLERLAFLSEAGQPSENLRQLRIASANGEDPWTFREERLMSFETWSLDGAHFVFMTGEDQQAWLGSMDGSASPFSDDPYGVMRVRWVDAQRLLYLQQSAEHFDFILADMQGNRTLLETISGAPPAFDFYLGF